jgi:hypothetical protein
MSEPTYGGQPTPNETSQQPSYGQPASDQPYGQAAPPGYVQPGYVQPGYGQPAADQPGYGQSYGAPTSTWSPPPAYGGYGSAPRRTFGVVGAILAIIGAAALVVAFTAVAWYSKSGTDLKYSSFHDAVQLPGADAFAKLYFTWLGWALLAASVVIALLANAPTGAAGLLRILGLIIGIGSAVVTIFALKPGFNAFSDVFKNTAVGLYLVLAGFVVTGIGAAIGPRRV